MGNENSGATKPNRRCLGRVISGRVLHKPHFEDTGFLGGQMNRAGASPASRAHCTYPDFFLRDFQLHWNRLRAACSTSSNSNAQHPITIQNANNSHAVAWTVQDARTWTSRRFPSKLPERLSGITPCGNDDDNDDGDDDGDDHDNDAQSLSDARSFVAVCMCERASE